MIGTYAAALAVCGAALAIGQATIALCGVRRWSWLSPALGLALLCGVGWATVRLPGDGAVSAVLILALTAVAAGFLWGRLEGGMEALATGLPVALPALAAASLPFLVEGHFGILGTGFNPDMSQHLLATSRLVDGTDSQLLVQGYPLGPHATVAALKDGLGIGLVQGFDGLTVAIAVLAPLSALVAFADQPPLRRTAAALLVGLPYLVASYYAQGAFKETIQALLVLAFVLALRESSRNPAWRELPLRFVPAALIAAGSVYVYSFPGLVWLGGTAAIWLLMELAWARYASPAGGTGEGGVEDALARSAPPSPVTGPAGRRALSLALIVFAVGVLPELGRMIDFQQFETFDPNGPGLGNLFGQLSPFEALGIWPSGDFRVAPGDGAAPALVYYLGAAFATALLLHGLSSCWRRRESAVVAGVLTAAGVYALARLGGTPYTAAKALEVAAPLITLTILLPLNRGADPSASPAGGAVAGVPHSAGRRRRPSTWGRAAATGPAGLAVGLYLLIAAACSLLAFANAPIGPTSYSPALTGLRPAIASDSTLVLAPDRLLDQEQGARYIAWELRGGRVCIEPESDSGAVAPRGVRFVVTTDAARRPPFPDFELRRPAVPYLLWERRGGVPGRSPCPLIAERQARAPGG
ncbi:MAG TPA: hypothetical protein VF729_05000 [Solirubrobacterales bacterium]